MLNEASDSRLVAQSWNTVNDQCNTNYDVEEIIYNIEALKCNLCDCNNARRGNITIIGQAITQVTFKNCAPFTKCITKTDGTALDDAKDLDLVMLMYNLLKYSLNYSDTAGSFWFLF